MKKHFGLPFIPAFEQSVFAITTQLERLLAIGGAVPLAVATVVAYFLFIGHHRKATA